MDVSTLSDVLRMAVLLGVGLTLAIAPVKKTVGGFISLGVTSLVLLWGLYVYSHPGFSMALFGSVVSRAAFLSVIAVWYAFDIAMIVRGRTATRQAERIEAGVDESPNEGTPLEIKAERASSFRRTTSSIRMEAEEVSFRDPAGSVIACVPRASDESVISFGGLLHGANLVVRAGGATERFLLSETDLARFRKWLGRPGEGGPVVKEASKACLECGAPYLETDYRASAKEWHCDSCRALLPHGTTATGV